MKTIDLIKIKELKTSLLVNPIFKKRFSPRVFSQDRVRKEDLKTIFEAVRLTPSSFNRQPWFFYLAEKGSDGFEQLSSLLVKGNDWAKKAPILIMGCYFERDDLGKNPYAKYDLGQAVATLIYQAQDLGYYTHQMGGFDHQKAKKLVKNPFLFPWVMIALGKIGDYEKADKKLIIIDGNKRERKEKIYEII